MLGNSFGQFFRVTTAGESHRPGCRDCRQSGLSLIEALVALAILGLALFFTLSLLAQERGIERRLAAHGEALAVLDTVHEAIRGGLPLAVGSRAVDWQSLYRPPAPAPAAAAGLSVSSTVEALSPRGLYRVTLRARYSVVSQPFDHTLETLVWRP